MASDYEHIAVENVLDFGRRFDDIGKFFAEQLYSDRTHFVYELLQNAEDALERRLAHQKTFYRKGVRFHLFRDRLELRHFGEPFNTSDVRGICGILMGTKAEDESQIGRFGIGFKSVYAYTSSPEVHSGDEHFLIEGYIKPRAVARRRLEEDETLFIFPFDHPGIGPREAFEQIRDRLRSLGCRTLLFLSNIDEISWSCEGEPGGTYLREDAAGDSVRRVTVVGERHDGSQTDQEEWLIFERVAEGLPGPGAKVETAFRLKRDEETGREAIVPAEGSELVVYFPTEKETHLGFLIQGPYKTTPARDNIVYPDAWNESLVRETAALVVEALRKIRDVGLLDAGFLEVLPIDGTYFAPGSPFRPVFQRVREALLKQHLLPTHSGHFVLAGSAKLAETAGLRELVPDEQLDQLLGSGRPLKWLPAQITQYRAPALRRYLMRELGVEEITPDAFARRLSTAFMKRQTDEWVVRLYSFLDDQKALWRPRTGRGQEQAPLRNKPFIRLQDLSHVPPFRVDGETPQAFLPIEEETGLSTVRREVAANEQARRFLVNLGLTEPDLVDEVIEEVLTKYDRGGGENIDDSEHERDLRKISRALGTDSASKRERLVHELVDTRFLLAHNAATSRVEFRSPKSVYLRSPKLELYFEGNPSAWFLDERYAPYRRELSLLGVSAEVRLRYREPDSYGISAGHVVISEAQSNHVRGLDGFDPLCEIDGLEHALETITLEKAAYIWNELLVPNVYQVRGVMQFATWKNYGNAREKEELSVIGILLTAHAWLPDPAERFRKPAELGLDDLPEPFRRDEGLAEALGMRPSDVAILADRLGISSEDIDFMIRHREELEAFKREIEERERAAREKPERDVSTGTQDEDALDFGKELEAAFAKPGVDEGEEPPLFQGPVGNPELRRRRTRTEMETAKSEEPELEQRFKRVPRKVWEKKDNAVRVFLLEQYRGKCQVCAYTFAKRDGEPYFEGLYLVSSTKARWIDRGGNVLCLCATCCAKFQHGEVQADDVLEQVQGFRASHEGGDGRAVLRVRLCGKDEGVEFSERHMIDLQEMLRDYAR